MRGTIRGAGLVTLWVVLGSAGCAGAPPGTSPGGGMGAVPVVGADETLDLGTWNLEWFGDPGNGPPDEAVQRANVARALSGMQLDVIAVQEVVDPGAFEQLVADLPGYSGLLATDAEVEGGAAFYGDFGGNEQKVGLIYRDALVEVVSAGVILTEYDHEFAGRPPLEAHLTLADGRDLFVIVLHAKAGAEEEDYRRRLAAAEALKAHLDAAPTRPTVVLGDFNDDMDVSIFEGIDSPYRAILSDTAEYRVPTRELSLRGSQSTVRYPDTIDHHVVSDEVWSAYVEGSAAVVRLEGAFEGYGETTSDHYPVASRYRM